MIDSNDVQEAAKAIAGLEAIDLSAVLQKYGAPPLAEIPRFLQRRAATKLAVRFALEKPDSLVVVCSRTAASTSELMYGRNGIARVLSEMNVIDFSYTRSRLRIRLSNGSCILGIPRASSPERIEGYQINLILNEFGLGQRFFDALLRQLRPLPGIENCIITITDDEADE